MHPEEDSIAETSVKTPLNSVDFSIFKATFILAERDLGFRFAKFKMADQCEATEGELNFHKRCDFSDSVVEPAAFLFSI